MSYTIPEYVDTKEQAVLALASTIADEDKSALGDGSVNRALDVLADTLAGENVDVPQTNAGAILALAQYVKGGGGAEIGDTPFPFLFTASAPVVGGELSESSICYFYAALVGDKTAASTNASAKSGSAASGVAIKTNTHAFTSCKAYKVVVDPDSEEYSSVAEVAGIVEKVDTQYDTCYYLITMPELQGAWSEGGWYEGEELHIYAAAS